MTANPRIRIYIAFESTERLLRVYRSKDPEGLRQFTEDLLNQVNAPDFVRKDIEIASMPSLDWSFEISDYPNSPDMDELEPDKLIISYSFSDRFALTTFWELALKFQIEGKQSRADGITIAGVGADPGGDAADHWCPGAAERAVFGHRQDARETLNADALALNGLTGRHVNVVIVDQGLNRAAIPPGNWGGGLSHGATLPGTAPRTSHGMMIARNVLDIAPQAVLYDVPLVPPRIALVLPFASDAHAVYFLLQLGIHFLRKFPRWQGPWVLVNAWAIFDRTLEAPLDNYTKNTHPLGHPLNNTVGEMTGADLIDIVFAAGNCGQFCSSPRCGPVDRGPGHSIWGANSHPAVITAGAVRADDLWLGYSSQGPGQPLLGNSAWPGQFPPPINPNQVATEKPDLCAPSNFRESIDASVQNTGTSTSCALTAGVVAALRSNPLWPGARVAPVALKQALIDTARETAGPAWSRRFGNGILNADAARLLLRANFP